jgi:hypothetical protein
VEREDKDNDRAQHLGSAEVSLRDTRLKSRM